MRVRVLVATASGTVQPFDFTDVVEPALLVLHDDAGPFAMVMVGDGEVLQPSVLLAYKEFATTAKRRQR